MKKLAMLIIKVVIVILIGLLYVEGLLRALDAEFDIQEQRRVEHMKEVIQMDEYYNSSNQAY